MLSRSPKLTVEVKTSTVWVKKAARSELMGAVQRALALYPERPAWEALMRRNMALDYSWLNTAAPKYVELYRLAVEKRQRLLGG